MPATVWQMFNINWHKLWSETEIRTICWNFLEQTSEIDEIILMPTTFWHLLNMKHMQWSETETTYVNLLKISMKKLMNCRDRSYATLWKKICNDRKRRLRKFAWKSLTVNWFLAGFVYLEPLCWADLTSFCLEAPCGFLSIIMFFCMQTKEYYQAWKSKSSAFVPHLVNNGIIVKFMKN